MERSAEEAQAPAEVVESGKHLLEEIRRFATVVRCRHAMLSAYFGETYPAPSCGACDLCLGEVEGVADSTVLAQKVLSCVARVEQRFGIEHVIDVLVAADNERMRRWGHDKLSTYGLLKELPRKTLTNVIYQLVDAGLVERTVGDRPVLKLNAISWEVLRGQRPVQLLQAKKPKAERTRLEESSWEDVDEALFDRLRALRREIAAERGVAAFVVLHDSTLRELARVRPATLDALRTIRGMGEKKLSDFGARLIECVATHERERRDRGKPGPRQRPLQLKSRQPSRSEASTAATDHAHRAQSPFNNMVEDNRERETMALPSKRNVGVSKSTLYDQDSYSWALAQARALRERRSEELDWDNLAEEVGDLAGRHADALGRAIAKRSLNIC